MRQLLYHIIVCCTAVAFLAACDKSDIPGGSVAGDGNSIILDLSSGSLPVSRAVTATGAEVKVNHIDVLIFDAQGNKKHHERVGGSETGNGTIVLSAKRSGFTENAKYEVHLIANSTADVSEFAANDFNMTALRQLVQTDWDIHMTGYPGLDNVPQTFLMDGIAHLEGSTDTQVVLNDGNKSNDTKLKATLRRAAAKLVIKIHKGQFVEFNNAPGTLAGYYLRNMPYSTSVLTGVNAEAALRTPRMNDGGYFDWTQDPDDPDNPNPDRPYTLITVTAYAYAHSWDNESSLEKETRLIVNIPMYTILHDKDGNYVDEKGNLSVSPVKDSLPNSYYQIPVCRGKELKRNTCYEVSLTLNVPGGTDPSKPIELEPIDYEVRDWDEKTINIGGDQNRPTYLTVNESEMEMRNISEDHTTLQFTSSSEVEVDITSVYYYDKFGQKQTLNAQQQAAAHISAEPDPGLTGKIDIRSDVPTNNAIRYIELTVTNKDGSTPRTVTIAQYPLEYITHVMGKHSYRDDFGVNGEDGYPTTYELLNGRYSSPYTTPTRITERRVACYYKNGEWGYENRRGYAYSTDWNNNPSSFFGSKVAKKQDDGTYVIYYIHWDETTSGRQYTYSRDNLNETMNDSWVTGTYLPGDRTYFTNPRMYHVQITASSGEYTLGKPRLDTEGYTDSGADNAQLVSPSFMLSSHLGITSKVAEIKMAKEHCKRYVEVAEDGTVYDDWRLPTRAEVEIIMKFQYKENAAMDEVLDGKSYWCADGELVYNSNQEGNSEQAIRCIRDAYDDKKTGN